MKTLNSFIIAILLLASCSNGDQVVHNKWCEGEIVDLYCPVGTNCYHNSCRYTVTYCRNCVKKELGRNENSYGWYKRQWELSYNAPFPYPRRYDLDKVYEPKTQLVKYIYADCSLLRLTFN